LCKIPINTTARHFPRNFAQTGFPPADVPRLNFPQAPLSPIGHPEMPLAAMRSPKFFRGGLQRLERSGLPARWINRAIRILFQNHVTAGCDLRNRHLAAY
jgi:hypothetical protein